MRVRNAGGVLHGGRSVWGEVIMQTKAEKLAESIMKAAGSSLKNYMPESKKRIISACEDGIYQAEEHLLDAAEKTVEMLNKFGNWDDGCFYYNRTAAPELHAPFMALKVAIAKAKER